MALPSSGTLDLIGTGSNDISYEVVRSGGGNDLVNLSVLAGKLSTHLMSEFYGFNGLMTLTIIQTDNLSDSSISYRRCLSIVDSNILGRSAGVRISSKVAVFRNSSGSPTAGSLGALVKHSSPTNTASSIQVWRTGTLTGVYSDTMTKDVSWNSTTPAHIMYMYLKEPSPDHSSNVTYASVYISSFWGACYSTSSGSPNTFGPF